MELSQLALYKMVFALEIIVAMLMFSYKLKKRNHFIIRLVFSIIVILVISFFFPLFKNISYTWWYTSLMFLILFFICVGMLFFIYDAKSLLSH